MDTPDGYEEQDAGAQPSAGTKPLLRTTKWRGHRSGAFERVLSRVTAALRPIIAAHLSEEHSFLFAEPVTDPDSGEVHWYSLVEGEVVSYADLVPQDRAAVDSRVSQLLFDLTELARTLQAEPQTLEDFVMGQLLELQLDGSYSDKGCLYIVGYQPVFAFWAFEPGTIPVGSAAPEEAPHQQEEVDLPPEEDEPVEVVAPAPVAEVAAELPAEETRQPWRLSISWSSRQWAIAAGMAAVVFVGIFGFSPRATVISWLDRGASIRAGEAVLLRSIARDRAVAAGGGAAAAEDVALGEAGEPDRAAAAPAVEPDEPTEVEEEIAEPMPPFESARGKVPIGQVQGSILLMHFWTGAGPEGCREITSFVSMVTSERFDPLRELGGEAYLVTNEASVEKGNALLKSCGVQDPFLLRDPDGAILASIAPGVTPPTTVVFDRLTEHTLATYAPRDWLDPALGEELKRLFLMQAF